MLSTFTKDWQRHAPAWLLTALTVVFGLQELRVLFVGFVGYLRDSVGMSSLSLAPVAIGIFALSFLAGLLNRLVSTRNALWVSAGGLALLRAAEQFAQTAPLDLYISAAAVVLFLIFIPVAIGSVRAQGGNAPLHFGLAFLLGLALDGVIVAAGRTLDLSWQSGLWPVVVVLALVVVQLWTLNREAAGAPAAHDGSWKANLATLAVGPWLFLQLLVFQSLPLISSNAGWHTPAAAIFLVLGNFLGLYIGTQIAGLRPSWLHALLAGALTLLALVLNTPGAGLTSLVLLLGQAFSMVLGLLLLLSAAGVKGEPGLLKTSLLNGLSQVFLVLLLFLYYASYDIDFGFRPPVLPLAAAAVVTLLAMAAGRSQAHTAGFTPAYSAAALLLIPLLMLPGWKLTDNPSSTPAGSVRIINYNVHDAVNTDGRVDPEALARVIEDSGADIVMLQEISRGWLIWGGMDMLEWFSLRLNMPYVWDATADSQWGMAIYSRYPLENVEFFDLPPDDVLLLRGFTVAEVDVNGQVLTLINTHYSEKDGQDEIRMVQSSAILDEWNGRPTTVVTGDFNARPESAAIQLMLEAGFIDVSRELGQPPTHTYYAADPTHQIDYIFLSPDLGYRDFLIPGTTASDHLPLIVTVEMP
ncbi:MAG: endonuclease/exonuclease/phosphatase family protein [Anaerolineales bacterium]|nr:endonuclease/exonuclease/phosphatase family protein [Anaerolineales bacterium]MCW5855065.1 endonuclease/exonuclease/phosphatase family protein [Anaerolineales bacterium]